MPKIGNIKAKHHDILFDLETGEYRVERRQTVLNAAPEYDPDCTTISFNEALFDVFRLTGESDNIIRHLYETVGEKLLFPSERRIAFYGYNRSTANKIITAYEAVLPSAINALVVETDLSPNSLWQLGQHRWNVFPIWFYSTKSVFNFANALAQETPGIFRKSIDGLSRLIKRGDFDYPESCSNAGLEMFQLADSVDMFIEYRLCIFPDCSFAESLNNVYSEFVDYCGGVVNISKGQFASRLKSNGVKMTYNSNKRIMELHGVALKI